MRHGRRLMEVFEGFTQRGFVLFLSLICDMNLFCYKFRWGVLRVSVGWFLPPGTRKIVLGIGPSVPVALE